MAQVHRIHLAEVLERQERARRLRRARARAAEAAADSEVGFRTFAAEAVGRRPEGRSGRTG